MPDVPLGKDARAAETAETTETTGDLAALRDALNARVQATFERAWPTVERELTRQAHRRWDAPLAAHRLRKPWTLRTTLRLLTAPAPSRLERDLGIANSCIHVEVMARVARAFEGWTVTFRAYPDHDEVQLLGARRRVLARPAARELGRALRQLGEQGPATYPLALLPPPMRHFQH